jgi:two-component system response regulator AtoC
VFILAEHFMRKFSARYERVISGIDPEARDVFRRYPWPGNVRELENLIERIFILEDDPRIMVRHLPARILRDAAGPAPKPAVGVTPDGPIQDFDRATQTFQQHLIRQALEQAAGSLGGAGRLLGLSRHALRHQMLKLGMR